MENYKKRFSLGIIPSILLLLLTITNVNVQASNKTIIKEKTTNIFLNNYTYDLHAFLTNEIPKNETIQQDQIKDDTQTFNKVDILYLDDQGNPISQNATLTGITDQKQEIKPLQKDGYIQATQSKKLDELIIDKIIKSQDKLNKANIQLFYDNKNEFTFNNETKIIAFIYSKDVEQQPSQDNKQQDLDKQDDKKLDENDQDKTDLDNDKKQTQDQQDSIGNENNNVQEQKDTDKTENDTKDSDQEELELVMQSDEYVANDKEKKQAIQNMQPFVMLDKSDNDQNQPLSVALNTSLMFVNASDANGVYATKQTPLYSLINLKSSADALEGGYTIITVPKVGFDKIEPKNISGSEYIKSCEITDDTNNYYIRINYNKIIGDLMIGIPFELKLTSPTENQKEFPVTQKTYDHKGNELASYDSFKIKAKTNINTFSFGSTSTTTTPSRIDQQGYAMDNKFYTFSYMYNTATSQPDVRNLKATVVLPENVTINPSTTNGWVLSSDGKTATRVFPVNSNVPSLPLQEVKAKIPSTLNYTFRINYENPKVGENDLVYTTSVRHSVASPPVVNPTYLSNTSSATYPNINNSYIYVQDGLQQMRFVAPYVSPQGDNYGTNGYAVLKEKSIYQYTTSSKQINISSLYFNEFSSGYFNKTLQPQVEKNKVWGLKEGETHETLLAEDLKMSPTPTPLNLNDIGIYQKIRIELKEPIKINTYNDGYFSFGIQGSYLDSEVNNFKDSSDSSRGYSYTTSAKYDDYAKNSETGEMYLRQKDRYASSSTSGITLYKRYASMYASNLTIDNTNLFNGRYTNAKATFYSYNNLDRNIEMKNAKVYYVVPNGITLSKTNLDKISSTLNKDTIKVIDNFNNSGKTAIVADVVNKVLPFTTNNSIQNYSIPLEAKDTLRKSNYKLEAYLIFQNNDGGFQINKLNNGQIFTNNNYSASTNYNISKNTDNPANFAKVETGSILQFIPPAQLIYKKELKKGGATTYVSNTGNATDLGDKINYKVNFLNNSTKKQGDIDFIDILPYKGDSELTTDGNKSLERNSQFDMHLLGPITSTNNKFKIYYSTDNPRGKTVVENYQANWTTTVDDYSKVTMYKVIMDKDQVLELNEEVDFKYDMKIPDDESIPDLAKADNTIEVTLNEGHDFCTTDLTTANVYFKTHDQTLMKYDAKATKTPIKDVKFKVINKADNSEFDNGHIYTTNENGKLIVSDLKPGNYYFKEVSVPNGYELAADNEQTQNANSFTITKNQKDDTIAKNIYNKAAAQISVNNYQTNNDNIKLSGSIFDLLDSNENVIDTCTTNTNGSCTFNKKLEDKRFFIKQRSLSSTNQNIYKTNSTMLTYLIKDATINNSVTFYNDIYSGSITLNKIDAKDNKVIPETVFEIIDVKTGTKLAGTDTFKTDKFGQIKKDNIQIGNYYFKEITAAPGYKLPDSNAEKKNNAFTITKANLTPQEVNVKNTAARKVKVTNYLQGTTSIIANSTFVIKNEEGTVINTLQTNNEGTLTFEDLDDTYYTIEQTHVSSEYQNSNEIKTVAFIKDNNDKNIIFYNKAVKGSFILRNIDNKTNEVLKGVEYKLYNAKDDQEITLDKPLITDISGIIYLANLATSDYYLIQNKTPNGYIINLDENQQPIKYYFNINKDQVKPEVKDVYNQAKRSITINNYVKDTTDKVTNATFEIKDKNGILIDSKETEDGVVTFNNLDDKYYNIYQTKVDKEYLSNQSVLPINFTIEGKEKDQEVNFYNQLYQNNFVLVTKDAKTTISIPNVFYKLYNSDTKQLVKNGDQEEFKSNEFGVIYVPALTSGNYYFEPISAPDCYPFNLDENGNKIVYNFTIDQNDNRIQPQRIDVDLTANRKIKVKDLVADTNTPIDDAKFTIYNSKGQKVKDCEKINGENGLYLFESLDDDQYTIEQNSVSSLYKINREKREVKFAVDNTEKEVVVYNELKDTGVNFLDIPNTVNINLKKAKSTTILASFDTSAIPKEHQQIFNSNTKDNKIATVTKATKNNVVNEKQYYTINAKQEGTTTFDVWINYPRGKILKTVKIIVTNANTTNEKTCNQINYDKLGRINKRTTCFANGNIERITSYQYQGNSKNYKAINVNYYSYHKNLRKVKNIYYSNYQRNKYLSKVQKDYNDNHANKLNRSLVLTKYSNQNTKYYATTLYYANKNVKYNEVKKYKNNGQIINKRTKEYFSNKVLRFDRYYTKYKGNQHTYRSFKRYNERKIIMNKEIATFNRKGQFLSKVEYRYNKKGKLKAGKGLKAYRITYQYKNGKAIHSKMQKYNTKGKLRK